MTQGRIYLDYAATTPVDPRVLKAMQSYFSREFGNPGSLHSFGQKAMGAADAAREGIANALGVGFREILFTGSATEANNLALRGVVKNAEKILQKDKKMKVRIIVSAIEHESILETAKDLENEGVEVVYLPVDKKGVVSLSALRSALTPHTVLVSVMYVNNETGAVQPVKKIGEIIRDFRGAGKYPLFHTDAAQAFQFFSCAPKELGVDLMTLSSHKIYGPKGVGLLYTSKSKSLTPILTGGGQEFGFRSGTENVPTIVGFAKAVELVGDEKDRADGELSILKMRERFLKGITHVFPKAKVNGSHNGSFHILNLWLPGHKAGDVLTRLDLLGIAISSGSACRSRSLESSYVLKAMGFPEKRIAESVRVSFGKYTTGTEISSAVEGFKKMLRS